MLIKFLNIAEMQDNSATSLIVFVLILLFSAIIHEVSHGQMALILGDKTAKLMGRITINPLPHLDPIGSILLPALLILSNSGFFFAWAKPVPVNPYNLKNPKRDTALVALAGPASNIIIAISLAIILRILIMFGLTSIQDSFSWLILKTVLINLMLAIFNLVPIPPLDGSKILVGILPQRLAHIETLLNQYGIILLFIFIFWFSWIIIPIINFLFKLLTYNL